MSSDMTPYRTNAIEPSAPKKFGLLIRPHIKYHECNTPGFFFRLWLLLHGKYVRAGSMFRCPSCSRLWVYELMLGWRSESDRPYSASPEKWKELGGVE